MNSTCVVLIQLKGNLLLKGPIDLTMLDPFETYPHYTKHLIKADHGIFIGSVAESSTPVVLVVEKLS